LRNDGDVVRFVDVVVNGPKPSSLAEITSSWSVRS